MPRDVSSSSSEDEADTSTTEAAVRQQEGGTKKSRFQCPADFVTFSHEPCDGTLTDRLRAENHELWLIKAPASFNPECFRGITMPLSGLQTLALPADQASGAQQLFSVLASTRGPPELRLLTAARRGSPSNTVLAPAFSGLLNVCENHGACGPHRAPQVIPATPAPAIPPGLRQRFQPFGSGTPMPAKADEAASSGTHRPLVVKRSLSKAGVSEDEEEEERKKKKKKKKEKRIKMEDAEPAVRIKQEAEEMNVTLQEEEGEKRKKKKKKKDKEREEVEEGVEPSVRVEVKTEPTDQHADATSAKKKKKKRSKTEIE